MTYEHCIRCYTPREWLIVLLLVCLSGYVVHNEYRATVLVRASIVTIEGAQIQLQLIRLNRERMELLHEMMFGAHRLPMDTPAFPDSQRLSFEVLSNQVTDEEDE